MNADVARQPVIRRGTDITSWNKGAERVFGYSAGEAIGRPITIVIPEDRQSEEREILTRIRRGERIDHFETIRRRRDGSLVNVSLTVSPIKDSNGKIVGASKIAKDISQQKRDQELIATLAREAEHRSKNLLSTALATVNLSRASSAEELKQVIVGRMGALSNVCSLFVESRWLGAELSAVVAQELAPYTETFGTFGKRVIIDGHDQDDAPECSCKGYTTFRRRLNTRTSCVEAIAGESGAVAQPPMLSRSCDICF